MGEFSIWHWIIVLVLFGNFAMIVQIAASPRTEGWKKALFVITALLIPVLPYLAWLIARKPGIATKSEARTPQTDAEVARTESRAPKVTRVNEITTTKEPPTQGPAAAVESGEHFWALAADEVDTDARRKGLWAKAFAEAQGNEASAKAKYMKWRVEEFERDQALSQSQALEVLRVREEEQKRAALAQRAKLKGQCPSCVRVISLAETKCPHCRASFGPGSPYKLLPLPNE